MPPFANMFYDLDHGSLTYLASCSNALPFIHSIPSKLPRTCSLVGRSLAIARLGSYLIDAGTWDHCLPQNEPRTATLRNDFMFDNSDEP